MKKKTAYVSLTYLFSFEPEELELNSNSPVEDIYNAAAKKIEELFSIMVGRRFSDGQSYNQNLGTGL